MLTDESINLSQNLLAKKLPRISSLMDAWLGKMHQFEIISVDKIYIQLLHFGSMYWVFYQAYKQINLIMVLIMFMKVYVSQKLC